MTKSPNMESGIMRDWDVVRHKGNHFTKGEIEFIRKSANEGKNRIDTARELKCSLRAIDKWYSRFGYVNKRKEQKKKYVKYSKPEMLKEEKEKRPLPDRYYHSKFEPS